MLVPDSATADPAAQAAEARRLQALREYDILDTPPEAVFDRVAAFTARLFGVPIVLVSLTDERRQWFKSCLGLDTRQIDRSLSFCAHALHSDEVLIVPDAALDPRFSSNSLVTGEPHVRFYAGAPLRTPDGYGLGTLCIIDHQPRSGLTPEEQASLQDLAESVMRELEMRRALETTRQALEQQRRSEALKSAVLASALDAVILMDRQGRVTEWNPAAERKFGYSREEALGQDLSRLIIPERFRADHHRGLAHYLHTGEGPMISRRVEVPALRRSGEEFPCEMAITPVRLGDEPFFTAYLRDLSPRKEAEAALVTSHNLLRAVVDTVPEAIYVKDLEGRYVMINAAGAALVGQPVANILGQNDTALFPRVTAQSTEQRDARVLQTGETLCYETTDLIPGGSFRTFLTTKSVYRDAAGEVQGLIGTSVDITDRKQLEAQLQGQNRVLTRHVQARTQELEEAQLEMLERLARAAEHRDDDTGEHINRVARMAASLARQLGLPAEEVLLIERAARLHDVGKIGVADAILLKPGRLTPEEFEVVKTHTSIGASILAQGRSALIQAAQEIALAHHERWDGAGYPLGLTGAAIPLRGRIVAVADVFDALTHERPYKRAWSVPDTLREIQAQAGRQFDPGVVAALAQLLAAGDTPG